MLTIFIWKSENGHGFNRPGVFLESPENFLAPKSHLYKHEPLILQSCHFNICLRPENLTYNKLSCLETSLFTSYSMDYRARNRPEKFWGFRETHASSENGYGF